MKYLKKFETENDRSAYENGESYIEPYVSYVDGGDVHYNKPPETRVIVTYNVTDASQPTKLHYYSGAGPTIHTTDVFDNVEVDGTDVSISDLDTAQGKYQLAVGEHTVKYTLKDPTTIDVYTFFTCTSLTSVKIPNSVTSIEGLAFYGCSSLINIDMPNSVTSIGGSAFDSTPWWTEYSADINNQYGNIIYINDIAYKTVNQYITECTFKEYTISVSQAAFQNCSSLTSVTIPNSVTSIGGSAFYECSSLTSVTIGNSVTSIGNNSFNRCSGLTSVTIPNSVTTIGGAAFASCSSLTSVTIGSGVTNIEDYVFASCSSLTDIISLATTAPTITNYTFNDIKYYGTLYVPSGSTGYDVWMGTGNYYLGKYGWTKVEQ